MLILEIIIIIVLVTMVALFINGIEDYCKYKHALKIPFNESLENIGLPVVTFMNNEKEFNFIIDTGASLSVIDERMLKDLNYSLLPIKGEMYGIDGSIIPVNYVKIDLQYDNALFQESFQVTEINAFDSLKSSNNIEIAGIISSDFMNNYQVTIDFIAGNLIIFKKNLWKK
jgi:hypothetical protein